jgi:uncharacterized protein
MGQIYFKRERREKMEINPIIKQVAMACNLNCRYCFYSNQNKKRQIMNDETLRTLIKEVCDYNSDTARFYWHGGEPLLAGLEFYEKAVALQQRFKRSHQEIFNGLVTNATLIDRRWAIFFRENKFGIGVSLDGPKEFHNQYRVFPSGQGSFDRVKEGIKILKEEGVDFHVLCVITNPATEDPKKLFDFFVKEKITEINLIPAIGIQNGDGISFKESVSPQRYVDLLIKIFNLWLEQDNPDLKILPLESIVRAFLGLLQEDCRFAGECEKSIVVDFNGDIFPCCTYGYKGFSKIGNISEGINIIINSERFQNYRNYLKTIQEKCSPCQWYRICRGGCPFHHYLGKGQNIFCKDFQRIFSYIEQTLEKINT